MIANRMNSFYRAFLLLLVFFSIPAAETVARAPRATLSGVWGGADMGMVVTRLGAAIDFDCAAGAINNPIRLNRQGDFDVTGYYIQGHGGPASLTLPPEIHPARYAGHVQGQQMFVTVTLIDTFEIIGSFSLVRGAPPQVFKCL